MAQSDAPWCKNIEVGSEKSSFAIVHIFRLLNQILNFAPQGSQGTLGSQGEPWDPKGEPWDPKGALGPMGPWTQWALGPPQGTQGPPQGTLGCMKITPGVPGVYEDP